MKFHLRMIKVKTLTIRNQIKVSKSNLKRKGMLFIKIGKYQNYKTCKKFKKWEWLSQSIVAWQP